MRPCRCGAVPLDAGLFESGLSGPLLLLCVVDPLGDDGGAGSGGEGRPVAGEALVAHVA
jgi:hypothetical protein